MAAEIRYDSHRMSWIVTGEDLDETYRLVVPRDFVQDEIGGNPDDAACEAWVHAHLPQILGAYTARTEGGWVKAPWDRVLVEVIE